MRVFLSAGEASGDAYGAALVREMRRRHDPCDPQWVAVRVWELARKEMGLLEPFELQGEFRDTWDWDSLEDEEFVMALEDEFGIALGREIHLGWKTNQDVLDAVFAALRSKSATPPQPVEFEGIGGPRMAKEGVRLHADTSRWGAISIAQSLAAVPRVFGGYYRAKRRLRSGIPGLFVPIDFGYANIRLARHAKNRGWRVLYFVPPGSWRRDRQGRDLPAITDAIVTPFEWSAEILRGMGADAHWYGHPIKQLLRSSTAFQAEETHGLEGRATVAVLPGSRKHEISENLPVIAEAVRGRDVPIEFALAPTVDVAEFQSRWRGLAPDRTGDVFTPGDTAGVLRRARAAIVCSGTATLEAALCRCPMVVVYRVSKSMVMEAKIIGFKRPKYIALPNILLDRPVVPELVQDEATPETVRAHLDSVVSEGKPRALQLAAFEELDGILGPDDAITRAAELALGLLAK
ncbi:MAG: hypothetical protein ACO1SV_25430 [Fimbriimonas sp.]